MKEELFNRVADHEVVIESGPVEYEKNDETNPVVEEDDFDELGEEDEEPISAAHLMGHLYNTGKYGSRVLQIIRLPQKDYFITGRPLYVFAV